MLSRWRVPAKVNWTLEVLGRRSDGFHELRSWFLAVDAGDRLELDEGAAGLELCGPEAAGVPVGEDNLVLRAEAAWRAAGGRTPAVRWRLEKRLPPGSGLGAGSADAAAALLALEERAERPIGLAACRRLAAALGSDPPFFLGDAGAELRGGRGEIPLRGGEPPADLHLVLAWPGFPVPTGAVFAALAAPPLAEAPPEPPAGGMPVRPGRNDLAEAARRAFPALAAFAARLAEHGRFHLSGSGGAHFAAASDPAQA
ncbi:MAG: 4-(cytidine 5'-diphospho)-2-C-methyl-D-erythritol kinase, partial [Planctomycetota bacterium]